MGDYANQMEQNSREYKAKMSMKMKIIQKKNVNKNKSQKVGLRQ